MLIAVAWLSAPLLPAQDVDAIYLTKNQNFMQYGPLTVGLFGDEFSEPDDAPFQFEAYVETPDSTMVNSGTLTLPGGSMQALQEDPPEGWEIFEGFDIFAGMESAYPPGNYSLQVVTDNDGSPTVQLELPASGYSAVTNFTVFDDAQAINPAAPFLFRWEAISDGAASDVVFLEIEDDSGVPVYESPDIGMPGQLTGLSTQVTVPAGTLDSGREYSASLMVFRPVDEDDGYPGVSTVSALGKTLDMTIRTTGASDTEPPGFVTSAPFPGEVDVALNTVVVFQFDEPMDTTVDAGQAINWSVLPDPFGYSWSPDGRRLFCNYGPGLPLPASTTVQWTLNPTGSATKLRDAAGNPLADDIAAGDFSTGVIDNSGDPDVVLVELGKVKEFFQDGPTPVDLGSYFGGFFVELNGIGTVSSVDLAIPGRGTATNVGEFYFDHRELEAELGFAEVRDLDTIFPDGIYTMTLHTVHDGVQGIPLTVAAGSYPNAPTVLDFAATQAVDGSKPFSLQWEPMMSGTGADYIELYVEGEFACYFESPAAGEPGALDGTATGITIPADILPPGRTLDCELIFAKVVDTESAAYPGVDARAVYASLTEFQIQTIGEPVAPRVSITRSGNHAIVTVTGEIGRFYELSATDNLVDWFPVWGEFLYGDCDGYLGSFEVVDDTSGVPRRFYQATGMPPGE